MSGQSSHRPGASFFICQSQPDQDVVDGRQGAGQTRGGTQFLEGQVGLFSQQRPQLVLMAGDDAGFAARAVMLGADVAKAAALLEELLDQAQRNPVTAGLLLTGALIGIVSGQKIRSRKSKEMVFMPPVCHTPGIMATVLFNLL